MKIKLSEEQVDEDISKQPTPARKTIDFIKDKIVKPLGMGALAVSSTLNKIKPSMSLRDANEKGQD